MSIKELEHLQKSFEEIYSILKEYGFGGAELTKSSLIKWAMGVEEDYGNVDFDSEYTESIYLSTATRCITISYGETKCVIMGDNGWVYKIPFARRVTNYCAEEVEIYEKAVKEKLDQFFAPCYFLEKIDELEVYAMAAAEVDAEELYSDLYHRLSSEGRSNEEATCILEEVEDNSEYVEWLFPYYAGSVDFDRFLEFLSDEGINDLHSGNIGYIDGNVVLIDYSGYRGQLKFSKNLNL